MLISSSLTRLPTGKYIKLKSEENSACLPVAKCDVTKDMLKVGDTPRPNVSLPQANKTGVKEVLRRIKMC